MASRRDLNVCGGCQTGGYCLWWWVRLGELEQTAPGAKLSSNFSIILYLYGTHKSIWSFGTHTPSSNKRGCVSA